MSFASLRVLTEQEVFEPAYYSLPELHFLLDHVGESPVVAMHGGLPKGVNVNMVQPTLAKLYEVEELYQKRGVPWAGVEAIRDSISAYLQWHEQSLAIRARGGPRHASMYGWEETGKGRVKAIKYASGSDADIVRSRIDENGEHIKFAVKLRGTAEELVLGDVAPWARHDKTKPPVVDEVIDDVAKGFMQCSICGFARNYDKDSHSSKNLARANVIKHLKSAKKDVERHRRLHLKVTHA